MTDRVLPAALAAFTVSLVLTPWLRSRARRRGQLDIPNDASSHSVPTPRNGGVAILAGVIAAALFAWRAQGGPALLLATLMLVPLPAIDEIRPLRRGLRLILQIALSGIAAVMTGWSAAVLDVPWLGPITSPFALVAIGVFWLVGAINGFNFMDGLNGLATTAGIVCGSALLILAVESGDTTAAIFAAGLAAAAAGFLPWNARGSIFMGDIGSVTLGFLIGLLTLRLIQTGTPAIAALLPLMSFVSDAMITVLRRAAKGERFFATRHRSHFYQWLNQQGWPHLAVTALWGALMLSSSVAAVLWQRLNTAGQMTALAAVVATHGAVFIWVAGRQRRSMLSSGAFLAHR